MTVWTIGHSNVGVEVLIESLKRSAIEVLCDIRRFPMSRRNPQFNREELAASLAEVGIEYQHWPSLGGRRTPSKDTINLGLRDAGFRGFADYMWTPEFEEAIVGAARPRGNEATRRHVRGGRAMAMPPLVDLGRPPGTRRRSEAHRGRQRAPREDGAVRAGAGWSRRVSSVAVSPWRTAISCQFVDCRACFLSEREGAGQLRPYRRTLRRQPGAVR